MDPSSSPADISGRIVRAVRATFEALPARSKPHARPGGARDWVPCSAVVVQSRGDLDFRCITLATGAKCLPAAKLAAARGRALHDSHAEVLALRLLNCALARECLALARDPQSQSALLRPRTVDERCADRPQPFAMRDGLRIFLYCSEAPCGDASMELCMAAQHDAAPWAGGAASAAAAAAEGTGGLLGRGYFSELGVVRRKPARADSPVSLSKSCSDKLALRQYTSVLSSATVLLIDPENAYLYGVVVPASQFVERSFARCFSERGRLGPAAGLGWPGGYGFVPFAVLRTEEEFECSRRRAGPKISNICAAWCAHASETVINGILQGRRETDERRESVASRYATWQIVAEALRETGTFGSVGAASVESYGQLKRELAALESRRLVKEQVKRTALRGWVANASDDFPL